LAGLLDAGGEQFFEGRPRFHRTRTVVRGHCVEKQLFPRENQARLIGKEDPVVIQPLESQTRT